MARLSELLGDMPSGGFTLLSELLGDTAGQRDMPHYRGVTSGIRFAANEPFVERPTRRTEPFEVKSGACFPVRLSSGGVVAMS